MNSCLYNCVVMHHRFSPRTHRFNYRVFMFYIDLDEVDLLAEKYLFISRNSFNFFSFRDKEHMYFPEAVEKHPGSIKAQVIHFLSQNGFDYKGERIMLLTNLNVLGYNFNPVSFYFIVNNQGEPKCAIAEVSNTFREMKPYFLGPDRFKDGVFHLRTPKYFYVSPFIEHDASFDFTLRVPAEKLNIRIDDCIKEERFFISTLTGKSLQLTNLRLLWYSLRFPIIPLRIMGLIHWNALLLWLKKIKYFRKSENMHLQRDVLRKYEKESN